jgi:RimJ/RimL family protein N-acetyltransferase
MRVGIRQFKTSDADGFYEAVRESIAHISPWLPWCTTDYSKQDAELWVASADEAWASGTDFRFIIEDRDSGKILGSVAINQVIKHNKTGNLGYWVRASALGCGVCTEAARQAIRYAFVELGFLRIEVQILTDNVVSGRVAERLGGVYEGTFRNKLFIHGHSRPAKCYSIIPSDYGL